MSHKILILGSYAEGDFPDGFGAGNIQGDQVNITLSEVVLGASETLTIYAGTIPPNHKILDATLAFDAMGVGVTTALGVVAAPDLSTSPLRDALINVGAAIAMTSPNTVITAASSATAGRLTNNNNTGYRIGIARDNTYKTMGIQITAPVGGITIPAGTVVTYRQAYRVASDNYEA